MFGKTSHFNPEKNYFQTVLPESSSKNPVISELIGTVCHRHIG